MDTTRANAEGLTSGAARRSLDFAGFGQVLDDAGRLASNAHRAMGRWSLAQTCKHLADALDGSIDGLNLSRHRIKRWFLAKRMLHWTLENGIPRGVTVDPNLTPPDDVILDVALAELRRAVNRYTEHPGRLKAHPLFGRLDRDVWDRLHLLHCAHHLSLLVPDR